MRQGTVRYGARCRQVSMSQVGALSQIVQQPPRSAFQNAGKMPSVSRGPVCVYKGSQVCWGTQDLNTSTC